MVATPDLNGTARSSAVRAIADGLNADELQIVHQGTRSHASLVNADDQALPGISLTGGNDNVIGRRPQDNDRTISDSC